MTQQAAGLPETLEAPEDKNTLLAYLCAAKEYSMICKMNRLADAIVTTRCSFLDTLHMTQEKVKRVAHEIRELQKREHRCRMYNQIGGVLQSDSFH